MRVDCSDGGPARKVRRTRWGTEHQSAETRDRVGYETEAAEVLGRPL